MRAPSSVPGARRAAVRAAGGCGGAARAPAGVAVLLPLLLLVLLLGACRDAEAPPPVPAAATAVTIETPDGVRLDAHFFEARTPRLAVFVHAYRGDQSDWYGLAHAFARTGRAAALTLDFRGYGQTEGERATDDTLVTDVEAAVAYGRSRGYPSVVLIGASMGGTAAIIAAARDPRIEGVIALSPPARFGDLDAIEAIRERKPLFAVIAARDDVSAVDSMRLMDDAVRLIPRFRSEVSGDAHGTELLTSTAGTDVRRRIDAMLTEIWDTP